MSKAMDMSSTIETPLDGKIVPHFPMSQYPNL
jgi:hypothetical protein